MKTVPQQIEDVILESKSARRRRDEAIDEMAELASMLCRLVGYEKDSEEGRIISSVCYSGHDFANAMRRVMALKQKTRRASQ